MNESQFIPFAVLLTARLCSHFDSGPNVEMQKQRIRLLVLTERGRVGAVSLKIPFGLCENGTTNHKAIPGIFTLVQFWKILGRHMTLKKCIVLFPC